MTRRTHSLNAYESDAPSGAIATGDITVTSALGLTAEVDDGMYLVVSPEDNAIREYIKITSVDTGSGLLGCAAHRGLAGSVGNTSHVHPPNAKVRAVAVSQWLVDIFDDIGDIDTTLAGHIPGVDPHPQYLDEGDGDDFYIRRDGTTPPSENTPWNAKKITELLDGVTGTQDAATVLQVEALDVIAVSEAGAYTDAEIVTHTAVANAHHEPYENSDAQALIDAEHAVHDADADAHHIRYTNGEAQALIDTHAGDVDAHHAKYTNAEAIAAVDNGTYLKLTGGTVNGDITADTIHASVALRAGQGQITYSSSQVKIDNLVTGKGVLLGTSAFAPKDDRATDLGSGGFEWDTIHGVDLRVDTINGGPATFMNTEAVLAELVIWANGQAAGITALS